MAILHWHKRSYNENKCKQSHRHCRKLGIAHRSYKERQRNSGGEMGGGCGKWQQRNFSILQCVAYTRRRPKQIKLNKSDSEANVKDWKGVPEGECTGVVGGVGAGWGLWGGSSQGCWARDCGRIWPFSKGKRKQSAGGSNSFVYIRRVCIYVCASTM